jgi:hypothetical protein
MVVSTRLRKLHAGIVRAGVIAGSVTFSLGLFGSSAALAQNCASTLPVTNTTVSNPQTGAQIPVAVLGLPSVSAALSGSVAVSGAVTAANTAFLRAWHLSPRLQIPSLEAAGICMRGAGVEMTLNSNSGVQWNVTVPREGSKTLNTNV